MRLLGSCILLRLTSFKRSRTNIIILNEVYNKISPRSYCNEHESESNSNFHDENTTASHETMKLSDDDRLIYELHLDACKVRAKANAYKTALPAAGVTFKETRVETQT